MEPWNTYISPCRRSHWNTITISDTLTGSPLPLVSSPTPLEVTSPNLEQLLLPHYDGVITRYTAFPCTFDLGNWYTMTGFPSRKDLIHDARPSLVQGVDIRKKDFPRRARHAVPTVPRYAKIRFRRSTNMHLSLTITSPFQTCHLYDLTNVSVLYWKCIQISEIIFCELNWTEKHEPCEKARLLNCSSNLHTRSTSQG